MTDTPFPTSTLTHDRASARPSGPCLRDADRTLTNEEFDAAVTAAAAQLTQRGVAAGDTVAVMLPNCVELVVTMFAAWAVGAALTPVNPALTDDEALYQVQDSTSQVIVGDHRAAQLAATAGVQHLDVTAVGRSQARTSSPDPSGSSAAGPEDFALIIYTSGTTGRPKGVLLDHANLTSMTDSLIQALALTGNDVSLLVLPLFHVNGLAVSVLSTMRAGGSVVIAPKFSIESFWDLVEQHRPTFFSAVPTIYALLETRTTRPVDTSSLRFAICGAAPMPVDLIDRIEQRFGVPVIEGYGLSESTVAATLNPLTGPRRPGTVGPPLPGQQVAIQAPDGSPAPAGHRGEVVIRGANVMRGYLGRPEATAITVRDGWLHTGDVGFLDDAGYLVLVDRMKDMIIRGGENIYPKEIEDVLYTHPSVLEAAVVGEPDPLMGEVPVGYVALRAGMHTTVDELTTLCRQSLARYKQPQQIRILPGLPKNSVGKLVKGLLRTGANPSQSTQPKDHPGARAEESARS